VPSYASACVCVCAGEESLIGHNNSNNIRDDFHHIFSFIILSLTLSSLQTPVVSFRFQLVKREAYKIKVVPVLNQAARHHKDVLGEWR